jgi:hypothetical protein
MLEAKVNGVAYETIHDADGSLPLLTPMSEVAGRMSVQVGAQYLEAPNGGRGVLLGGVPGVAPANCVIIGGGVVGTNAAKIALGMGAHVAIIDRNLNRLRQLDDIFGGQIVTLASNLYTIREALKSADLVVGAVLIPGASAPKLVRRDMIANMKRGAVVVDVAIDQGGCFRDFSRHHPHGARLLCGWRVALLRLQHAGRCASHFHFRAHQRHFPLSPGTGEQGTGARLHRAQGTAGRCQHVQRLRDACRGGGVARAPMAGTGRCSIGNEDMQASAQQAEIPPQPLTALTEEEKLFQTTVRQFAREQIGPYVREMDEAGVFRKDIIRQFFELGLMGIEIPEEYGGSGGSFFQCILAVEELSAVDPSAGVIADVQNTIVNNAILRWA